MLGLVTALCNRWRANLHTSAQSCEQCFRPVSESFVFTLTITSSQSSNEGDLMTFETQQLREAADGYL